MAIQIQYRRGTAAEWTSTNPTLAEGEPGYETDTGKFKVGNGSTAWTALAYSSGIKGDDGADGAVMSVDGQTGAVNLSSVYQPLDADLTSIAGLAGTSGLLKKTAANTWTLDTTAYTTNTGTVTSVGVTVPTGLSVSGTPITSSGTFAISLAAGYSIPTTSSQTNWDTAYTDRNKWDGGATGLTAATGRTSLGLGTAAVMTGPSGTIVGTTDSQTLTNKTLTGYTETVYSLSGTAIDPANGTIQYKTLSANTTFTESLADGQSVTLMLNPGTYTATWPTTTWIGSAASTAPTLVASVYNCITFFQFGGTLYGKYEGRV